MPTDTELKIGHFMVAIGAIIEDERTGEILVSRRQHDFQNGEWEITYGRIDQFEDLDTALFREVKEETGLINVEIKKLMRVWHIFRGEHEAEKEVYGFTFYCTVKNPSVKLSEEHTEFKWVTPQEALQLIKVPGIKKDVELFIEHKTDSSVSLADEDGTTIYTFE